MVIIEFTEDKYESMIGGLSDIANIANNMVECLSSMKEYSEDRGEYKMGGNYQSDNASRSEYRMGGNYNRRPMYRMGGRYGNY